MAALRCPISLACLFSTPWMARLQCVVRSSMVFDGSCKARVAPSTVLKVTKPNPRDCPVARSKATVASSMAPYVPNTVRSVSAVVLHAKPRTKSLRRAVSSPVDLARADAALAVATASDLVALDLAVPMDARLHDVVRPCEKAAQGEVQARHTWRRGHRTLMIFDGERSAAWAPASVAKVTNPNPRLRPVLRSTITTASWMGPYTAKASCRSASVVSQASARTKSLRRDGSAPAESRMNSYVPGKAAELCKTT